MRKIFAVASISLGILLMIYSIIEVIKNTSGDYGSIIMIPYILFLDIILLALTYGVYKRILAVDIIYFIFLLFLIITIVNIIIDSNFSFLSILLPLFDAILFVFSIFFIWEDIKTKKTKAL